MRFSSLVALLVWLCTAPAWAVCTLDPANVGSNITLSGGNLTWASTTSTDSSGVATSGAGHVGGTGVTNSSAKLYFEMTVVATSGTHGAGVGITTINQAVATLLGSGVGANIGLGLYSSSFVIYLNGSDGTLFTFVNGDIIGVAVDFFAQKIWWTKNGTTWNNDIIANQNPATSTGGKVATANAPFGSSGAYTTVVPGFGNSGSSGNSGTFNFAGPFSYTLPSGYSAWCAAASGSTAFFQGIP